MISKKLIPALLISTVLAASLPPAAMAHDRYRGLGIAAGIFGALAVGSVIANAATVYAPAPPVYQVAPPPTYYPAPQQVYYQPAPVYVQPAPVYVRPAPVYVQRGYSPYYAY